MHVMSVNCRNNPLQNVFPKRNHSVGTRAGRGNILGLRSISLQKFTKKLCVCVCALYCLAQLSSSWSHLHLQATRKPCVCTQSKDCYHCSNSFFFLLFITWSRKNEKEAEKNVEKGKQEGREWWKREGKASLMFPAKIFRLLPHDASPCPTDTRTLTHSHIYTQSKEPFLAPLPRVPLGRARRSRRPYLTMLNFLFTRFSDSWLVNNLGKGVGREIQWVQQWEHTVTACFVETIRYNNI